MLQVLHCHTTQNFSHGCVRHLCEPFEWKRWCGWAHTSARFQFACSLLLIMWSAIEARRVAYVTYLDIHLVLQGRHESLPNLGWQSQLQSPRLRQDCGFVCQGQHLTLLIPTPCMVSKPQALCDEELGALCQIARRIVSPFRELSISLVSGLN